jgi:hypothetical protein
LNNKTKIAGGISVTSLVIVLFHLFHFASSINDEGKDEQMIKNAKTTIILTDSAGKKDTMLLEDYMKLQK